MSSIVSIVLKRLVFNMPDETLDKSSPAIRLKPRTENFDKDEKRNNEYFSAVETVSAFTVLYTIKRSIIKTAGSKNNGY